MVVPEIVQTSCMTIEVLKNQWFSWGSPMTQENHVASAVAISFPGAKCKLFSQCQEFVQFKGNSVCLTLVALVIGPVKFKVYRECPCMDDLPMETYRNL